MEYTALIERYDRLSALLKNHQLFFVSGAPKSGTTWLQKALDAHPQIICAGEGHFMDKFANWLDKSFKDYRQHQAVVARNVYEGRPYYPEASKEDFEFLIASFVLNAFSRLELTSETRIVGDKTPANVEYLNSLYRFFPGARFINIVRDGRDVLVSMFKHAERVNRLKPFIDDMDAFLLEKTRIYSSRWVRALEIAEEFDQRHPGILHTVRYEDLKQDFAAAFSGVLRFLEVDVSETHVGRCENEASFKRLSAGREPGEEDPNAFVRKGIVGDWRENLQPQHVEIFNEIGADWLDRLGYDRL